MNFLLSASSLIFPLVTFPYVSRVLGRSGVGSVSYATSLVAYFCMLSSLGIPSYGIYACAKVRNDKQKLSKTVQELLMINTATALCVCLLAVAVIFLSRQKMLLFVCSFAIVLEAMGALWLYRALEQYSFITAFALVCKMAAVVLMFVFVKDSSDVVVYGALTVLASFGVNIFSFLRLKKYVFLKPMGNYSFKRHLKPILVFFATSVAISVYTNLDTVMLGVIKNAADVGIYSAAVKIRSVLTTLSTSLGAVALPRLTEYISNGETAKFKKLSDKIAQFVFSLALPLCVFFVFFAKEAVLLLSGEEFSAAVLPAMLLTPAVLIVAVSNVTGVLTLVPLGRERAVMVSVIIGASVDFLLNTVLIPRFSYVGAAVSTLVAELIVLAVQLCYLKRSTPRIRPLLPLAFTAVALFSVSFINISDVFLNLSVSFFVFFAVYAVCIFINKKSRA